MILGIGVTAGEALMELEAEAETELALGLGMDETVQACSPPPIHVSSSSFQAQLLKRKINK